MKRFILSLLLILGVICGNVGLSMAQPATEDEALAVAANWIAAVIAQNGGWGDAESAEVKEISPFSRNGQQVGYFCQINPTGFIIISIRKEMAPVKAYSATSTLDPLAEEGLTDLLKGNMERILSRVRAAEQLQLNRAPAVPFAPLFEIDYRSVWSALQLGDPKTIIPPQSPGKEQITKAGETIDGATAPTVDALVYAPGTWMLTSQWHQGDPYNGDTPDMGCAANGNNRALVGCVATAGAQLMRYWNWPPYGEGSSSNNGETVSHTDTYDWSNMLDDTTIASTWEEQQAVAELSHEVGVAVSMNYGCDESSASTADMEGVFEDHYRFSSTYGDTGAVRRNRSDFTAAGWFELMQGEFNKNRPVLYRIGESDPDTWGHAIVGDGWQVMGGLNQYHMNYGWGGSGSSNAWYTVDSLVNDPEGQEFLIERIIPAPYMTTLSGVFPMNSFRYRYFTVDTTGSNGTFAGGQMYQFLPGVVISCSGDPVRFENSSTSTTRFFTRGDQGRGIYMNPSNTNSAIKFYTGGGIKVY